MQNDRVVIPAVETIAGLFEENIFSRIESDYRYLPTYMINDQLPSTLSPHPEGGFQVGQRDEASCVCANVSFCSVFLMIGMRRC